MQTKEQFLNSLVKKEDKVKEALTKLYQGVRATNEFLGLKNSQELQSTYYQLRVEEISELFTAIENQDKVEFLDAIVDGLVVVGYEYYLKNKRKKYNCKPEDSIKFYTEEISNIVGWLDEYYEDEYHRDETLTCLQQAFNIIDIDHIKAVNEVLESNLSKFPTKQELREAFVERYDYWRADETPFIDIIACEVEDIENQGRYISVHHEIRVDNEGNERIIFWANGEKQSDGSIKEFKAPKYIKPCTYKNPDFASCWLN